MKRMLRCALPAAAAAAACFFLAVCLDVALYHLSPWSGTLAFFDLTPLVCLVSGAVAVAFGALALFLHKRFGTPAGGKPIGLRLLPLFTGVFGCCGLLRLLTSAQDFRSIVTDRTYLGLTIEQIYQVHRIAPYVLLGVTAALIVLNLLLKRKK